MLKLIRWQLREYRSAKAKAMLGFLAIAAVAAWLSYTLLSLPAQLISVFRMVQLGALGGLLMLHYYPYLQVGVVRDAHTLPLHVALPQRWALVAKVIAKLPLLAAYMAVNALLYYVLPPDFPGLQEFSWQASLVRAPLYIFGVAILMSALVLRTVLRSMLALPVRWRFLGRRAQRGRAFSFALDATLVVVGAALVGGLIGIMTRVGAVYAPSVEALIFAVAALALTWLNGFLLERYTPQLELL